MISLESIKRKLKKKVLLECRCDERLKDKADGSTCLVYTGYLLVPFVYYESLKRELQTKPTYEFRYDERLKTKVEEHLKIETRSIDEMFASEMGEYVFLMCCLL